MRLKPIFVSYTDTNTTFYTTVLCSANRWTHKHFILVQGYRAPALIRWGFRDLWRASTRENESLPVNFQTFWFFRILAISSRFSIPDTLKSFILQVLLSVELKFLATESSPSPVLIVETFSILWYNSSPVCPTYPALQHLCKACGYTADWQFIFFLYSWSWLP